MREVDKLLSHIQMNLKAPKSQYNSFGKYNYRNKEDILEGIKPILGDGSIIVIDDVQLIGDRFYVKSTARLSVGDESIEATGWAREPLNKKGMDESMTTGTAASYAGKRALGNLLAIDDTKDNDFHHGQHPQTNVQQQQQYYSNDQYGGF
jgi:hypothetical protein